jgi:hypothetical protein
MFNQCVIQVGAVAIMAQQLKRNVFVSASTPYTVYSVVTTAPLDNRRITNKEIPIAPIWPITAITYRYEWSHGATLSFCHRVPCPNHPVHFCFTTVIGRYLHDGIITMSTTPVITDVRFRMGGVRPFMMLPSGSVSCYFFSMNRGSNVGNIFQWKMNSPNFHHLYYFYSYSLYLLWQKCFIFKFWTKKKFIWI